MQGCRRAVALNGCGGRAPRQAEETAAVRLLALLRAWPGRAPVFSPEGTNQGQHCSTSFGIYHFMLRHVCKSHPLYPLFPPPLLRRSLGPLSAGLLAHNDCLHVSKQVARTLEVSQ